MEVRQGLCNSLAVTSTTENDNKFLALQPFTVISAGDQQYQPEMSAVKKSPNGQRVICQKPTLLCTAKASLVLEKELIYVRLSNPFDAEETNARFYQQRLFPDYTVTRRLRVLSTSNLSLFSE